MSTFTMPKPLPLRRMIWVTWRQHRLALLGVAAIVATAVGCLLVSGIRMRAAATASHAGLCAGGPDPARCRAITLVFISRFDGSAVWLSLLHAVPGLIGMFVGAPLLARDFELGTMPFVWCQGFTPLRWTATKLVLVGGAVGAAVVPIGMLFAWWYPPGAYVVWGNTILVWPGVTYPLGESDLFPAAYVRWTLLAFVLGALAGALLRRTVPAMVLTGACYTAFLLFSTTLNAQQATGFWPWLLPESNALLVYTGLLAVALLWHVHRHAGRTR
jgi:hypothetical protein